MVTKKFNEYNMRDEFSFPVYVASELMQRDGIKGIDPDKCFAGVLTRHAGSTYLELSGVLIKPDYKESGFVLDNEEKVTSNNDLHELYACTWNGDTLFVLHKYLNVKEKSHFSNYHFGYESSRWLVSDYSIVNQFMLFDGVYEMRLSIDYVHSWLNLFRPDSEFNLDSSVEFTDLKYENETISLSFGASEKEKRRVQTFEKRVDSLVTIKFERAKTKEFSYHLAVLIRNLFQMLIHKEIGISRIIINQNKSLSSGKKRIQPKDERENWFLDQSFLPEKVEEKPIKSDYSYKSISKDIHTILREYLRDEKLQNLVSSYLTVDHFHMPVDTQIVTLVSCIESYYSDAKYKNGKKIKQAGKKLERLISIIDDPSNLIENGELKNVEVLVKKMVDARDYIVHGVKKNKYSSETGLVPYLLDFKKLIRFAVVNIIINPGLKNN